jgi:DNA-binding transcriptional LysR family regulator
MTLDQLRIFIAVADVQHVTRAAELAGLTQSAASASIAALERQYDTKLFSRVGRGIELTEMGRRFLPEARAVLDRVHAAKAVIENRSGALNGKIAIAASETISNYWLPRCLSGFRAVHPEVQLDVATGKTSNVERLVVHGEADIGLIGGITRHPAISRIAIARDRLVMVCASDYSLAGADAEIDLRPIPWIVREEGSGSRAALEDLARSRGLILDDLKIPLVLPSNEAVRQAVESGAGATIISEHVVKQALESGRLRRVNIALPTREFVLIRHSQRVLSDAPQALIKYILDALPSLPRI